ncbi:MAG: autotransporter-associated beta strand repeat-containing protein [Kiritimatiellaeota bacterium]|nr:autotransporter-associated beta strand repeat-containing protein [Kiritimatiellota bacterium]
MNNALPTNLALLIASHTGGGPCTFDLNGHSQTIAGLGMGDSSSVANNIVTNSVPATLATFTIKGARAVNTFGGIIAGNIALVVDSSTQALTNNSTFTGGTTVTNGAMLLLGSTNALGIGPLTVTSDAGIGTTYAVDQTFVNWVTNTAGTAPGVILLGANSASNLTFGGSLSNTFLGAAGGAYSYSGNATWPDTTVRLGGGSSNLIYATVIGSGTNLLVGPIGGNAASIVSVTNAAHNPDTTTIQSGTLQVGNNSAGTLGTGTVSITSGATLTFYNNATMTNTSGVISGPGAVAARGSVVYMPSSNAYTGGTFLNGGNVRLALGDDNALGTGPITFSSAGNNPALSSIGSTMRTLTNSIVIGTNVTFGTGTDNGLLVFTSDVNLTGGTRTLTVTAPVTFNSVITNGGLTKAGTAQLTLTGTNTYALGTILTAGTLSIGDYANLPTTGPVTFNGGTLQITGTTVTDLNPYTINWTNFNGGLDIASSANTLTINTNITSSAAFYKYGDGTLIMGGTNSLTGGINVKGGTLEIGSIASLTNSGMTVGGTTTATLRLDNGGQIFATGDSVIGNTNALNGAVIQDGGIFTSSAALRLATYSNATVAAYQMNGGAINLTSTANSYLLVGRDGVGTFMQSGGTVTVARTTTGWGNGALTLGSSAGATGIYTLAGGTLNVTNSNANSTTVIGYGGTGFLTISNVGTVANLAGPIVLGGNGGTGTVNLVAGELRFTSMFVGTTNGLGTFNWSGGTLRPFSTDAVISNNLPLMLTGAGATFNTLDAFSNTRNITVLSTINENGGSYGLTKLGTGALILAGTNTYSGGTEVRAGGLSFANTSAKPVSGTVNVFSNAALGLGVGGTGYFSSADVDALWGNSLSGVTMDPDALVGIDTSAGNFTYTTIQSTRGLAKFGANTLTISNANTYPGPTVIYGGTLQINDGGTLGNGNGEVINNARLAFNRSDTYTINNSITGTGSILISANGSLTPASVFAITGSLTLGETNGNVGNFNLANNSASIGGLTVSNHNITPPSTLTIGNGQTLVVNGPFQVGAGVAVANNTFTTKLTVSGAGSLIVTNLGGTILFGNSNGNIKDVHNLTTVDMLGLGTFIANLGTNGTFRLGSATTETGVASNLTTFATNTIITAGTVRIDHQGASAGADIVRLGVGSNTINANTINVGVGDIRAHNTYLQFATNTGTVSIHAADGVGAANLTIGVRRGTGNITNVVDFTGHLVDLNLNLLDVGGNGFNVSGGSQILGSFAVDAGTTRVTTVRAGSMQNLTTNGQAVGIITFGGGEVQVGSGGITLATNFTALTSTRLNGTLNVSGGTVTVGTNSAGNSLTLTAGNGINNALVNLTGGQLTLGGHAVMGAAGGANTATVTLAGATLDLTGHNIGSGTQPINLSLQSGTLVNLGEINGGAPLVKTTGGTLTVLGNNSYSGGTLISGGTLQLGDGTANNGSVIGNITNNAALVFANPNAQTFDGVISGSGTVTKNAAGTLTFTGTNTYTGTTTITAGSLLINGTQTSGGLINVLSGGTLGGTGTLGNVTVYAGGVFAPGNGGAGTQMTGMLSMTGGLYRATLVNSNSFSQVVVANTLNVSSTPTNYL